MKVCHIRKHIGVEIVVIQIGGQDDYPVSKTKRLHGNAISIA